MLVERNRYVHISAGRGDVLVRASFKVDRHGFERQVSGYKRYSAVIFAGGAQAFFMAYVI